MEELLELKQLIVKKDLDGALALLDELLEMSKKDIINNIYSFCVILLLHLIKQQAEKRSTRSWEASMDNAALRIKFLNKRHKNKGYYLNQEEMRSTLKQAWREALNSASREAFEGIYSTKEISERADKDGIIARAMELIWDFDLD